MIRRSIVLAAALVVLPSAALACSEHQQAAADQKAPATATVAKAKKPKAQKPAPKTPEQKT